MKTSMTLSTMFTATLAFAGGGAGSSVQDLTLIFVVIVAVSALLFFVPKLIRLGKSFLKSKGI